jgi:PAS domain S-box-containing protein
MNKETLFPDRPLKIRQAFAFFFRTTFLTAVIFLSICCLSVSADEFPKQVLMITSYHQGDTWNDDIVSGVQEIFSSHTNQINLFTEHLDSRRNDGDDHTRLFFHYLKGKYAEKTLDLIILSDDAALHFFIRMRSQFPGDVPAVFCGINNFTPEILAGHSNITGVNEQISIEKTLEMAFDLFPDAGNIVAVCDNKSEVGKNNLNIFRNAADQFKDRAVFSEALNLKNTDAPEVLGKLSPGTLIFRLNNLLNEEENFVSIQETMRILSKNVSLPIFTAWDFDMGLGAIGGVLVSALEQGRKAAALSLQILDGKPADQIPVIMESPNIPFIDFQQARRFDLTFKDLPDDAQVINIPESLWDQYKNVILFISSLAILLMAIVILQTVHLRKRYRIEQRLVTSKNQISSIFRSAPVGIGSVVDRVMIKVNNRLCEMTGYTEKDLIGKNSRMLYPGDEEYEFVGREKYAQIADHVTGTVETRWKKKDGTIIDVLLSSTPVDLKDHSKGVTFIALDITERKQAENDLENEKRFLAAVFDNIEESIVICDENGALLRFNKAARKLHGLPEKPITPDQWSEHYSLFMKDGITQMPTEEIPLYRALQGEHVRDAEMLVVLPDTTPRYLVCNGQRLTNNSGKTIGAVVAMHDDTRRRMAEMEQEKLQAQLHQAQKLESVGRLAGGVAHDFNNMLGVILGHTELALLKTDEDNDLVSDLNEIQKAAKRSADITKQLLAFARKDIISPRKLDLNDTVESMLNMLRRLIGEDIDLVWKPAAHIWPVKMDPSQIDQILANLCVNARDAIAGVGKLTIETERKSFDEEYCKEHPGFIPGDYVLLAVSDNGCGMDKETLDNLFEPFFTTKDVGKGTGLGLATVYGIVKQNNGFINVYSEHSQGSTFKIYLPRLVADEDTNMVMSEKKATAGGTETILLVEDEPSILRMTRMMLEKKGYTVIPAISPAEAMEKAKNHSGTIDLLMTDVIMPEMNGKDLAGKIIILHPGIKLLFMSGYTADIIGHQKIMEAGSAFIQKPFSMADMTEKVRELLNMASDKS